MDGVTEMHLRAQALRSRLYYRMDAIRRAKDRSFPWPADVLAGLEIPWRDLGVVAFAEDRDNRIVYFPLRITQRQAQAQGGEYRVVIVPGC